MIKLTFCSTEIYISLDSGQKFIYGLNEKTSKINKAEK